MSKEAQVPGKRTDEPLEGGREGQRRDLVLLVGGDAVARVMTSCALAER